MPNIADIIDWKFNAQEGMETINGIITKFPGGIPSQADQDAWSGEYEKHVADTAYIEKREKDYLPLEEQLDMFYWDKVNGTDNFMKHRAKVKADYPKP